MMSFLLLHRGPNRLDLEIVFISYRNSILTTVFTRIFAVVESAQGYFARTGSLFSKKGLGPFSSAAFTSGESLTKSHFGLSSS